MKSERTTLEQMILNPLLRVGILSSIGLEDDGRPAAQVVDEIARRRQVRAAIAAGNQCAGALAQLQLLASTRVPTEAEQRAARHQMYSEGLLTPARRPSSDDRCRANAKKWGLSK